MGAGWVNAVSKLSGDESRLMPEGDDRSAAELTKHTIPDQTKRPCGTLLQDSQL